jgi:hypothetical protein
MQQLLTLLFVICLELSVWGRSITGIVFDAETKAPLPNTNIKVMGQHKGTISNTEGYFILDMEGIVSKDTIIFSYAGYETLKFTAAELHGLTEIYMRPATLILEEIEVSSRSLTAGEIIVLVNKNYHKNHPASAYKQKIFFHKYEKTPFPEKNKIILKKSDFVGMDKNTFNEVFKKLPSEFIEYRDAIVELYSDGGNGHRLVPVEGISLEENSQKALVKELENKLGTFLEDIQKSQREKDLYYKIRTGILSQKIANWNTNDSVQNNKRDSLNYFVQTEGTKNEILNLFLSYANIESKNWEFINKSNKYNYSIKEVTAFNDELVYEILFTPKKNGLFEGRMYISTTNYAILQLDFAFAKGKKSENFKMLGFGHSMDDKKGRVIFERGNNGYFVKYISAQQRESVSINRDFSIMKKQRRFLVDKELNEIKLTAQLFFDIQSSTEILVLEREGIDSHQFENIKQPTFMKFRKEYTHTPRTWNDRSGIAPVGELKKFKRK